MSLKRLYLLLFPALLLTSGLHAQNALYPDLVYKPSVRNVQLVKKDAELAEPVIQLNSDEKFIIRFDELGSELKNYTYTIVHCNYDWSPSDLSYMQYMTGFESYDVLDFRVAQSTTAPYIHYTFEFPNDYMTPVLSGNYLVKVYGAGNPEDVVFTRRFMISEKSVFTNAKVRAASLVSIRNESQEIYFNLSISAFNIVDRTNDLKVTLLQNNRWDNAIYNLAPRYFNGTNLDYQLQDGSSAFESGNQWRSLDLKTLRIPIPPARKVLFDNDRYHILVDEEKNRAELAYLAQGDINGKMAPYNSDYLGFNIDPDYAFVYFSLPSVFELENKDVYLISDFTFGCLLPEYKMLYDEETRSYNLSTLLKQGYYNYMYVTADKGSTVGSTAEFEGNFMEAENNYTVLVYVREPGDVAMRLVCSEVINSLTDR